MPDFRRTDSAVIAPLLANWQNWISLVTVQGMEVTQAIQYHRADQHLTDAADRGADNSVRLVADKPAWVRVYVRSRFVDSIGGLTGSLLVERRLFGFWWKDVATLSPVAPGTVTARRSPAYATQRGTITESLNFVVPADVFAGMLRLTVTVNYSYGRRAARDQIVVDATLRQTLRLRGILVSYNGPSTANPPPGPPPSNLNLPAPTLADLQATSALAMRAMPVQSQGEFTSAGTLPWNQPLDDPRSCAGCCSPNWNALLGALGNVRTNDGNRTDVVYYGLLPTGIPLGVPGCGSGGLGSAVNGDQGTLFHEIGHGYGFQHTPCGNGGAADPNYPTYEPYPSASIGEYGLDIANGAVMSPASWFDYMSYCFPQWMSLYQHNRLIMHTRLRQEWVRDDPAFDWWRWREWRRYWEPRDLPYPPDPPYRWDDMQFNHVIAISGIVHGKGEVEVRSVARVPAAGEPPGSRTGLVARLVDDDGKTLARGVVRRLNAMGGGCGCGDGQGDGDHADHDDDRPYAFEAYVPDVAPGAALVIDDGERAVWTREAPASPPSVRQFAVAPGDGAVLVRWSAGGRRKDAEDEGLEAWAQWSDDGGKTWRGLATGLRPGQTVVGLAGVPSGSVLVRLLAHDGFSTAVSEPVTVEVRHAGVEAVIMHPENGAPVQAGGVLRAWASVTDQGGRPAADAWCRWLLDGREVGQGTDVWLTAPDPGRHRLTLLVRAEGTDLERSVEFESVGTGEPGTQRH